MQICMQDELLTGFHTKMSAVCPILGARDPPLDIKPDWVDNETRAPEPVRVKFECPRSFSRLRLASGDANAIIDLCERKADEGRLMREQGEAPILHLAQLG